MQADDPDDTRRIKRIQRLTTELSKAIASSARQRMVVRERADLVKASGRAVATPARRPRRRPK
jgi:hypothetical protein